MSNFSALRFGIVPSGIIIAMKGLAGFESGRSFQYKADFLTIRSPFGIQSRWFGYRKIIPHKDEYRTETGFIRKGKLSVF